MKNKHWSLSEETKEKMSDAHMNRKFSDETKKKMSAAHAGVKRGKYKKSRPSEFKVMAEINKLKKSTWSYNKVKDICMYKKNVDRWTNEQVKLLEYTLLGKEIRKRKPMSEETKKKISESMKKKYT